MKFCTMKPFFRSTMNEWKKRKKKMLATSMRDRRRGGENVINDEIFHVKTTKKSHNSMS